MPRGKSPRKSHPSCPAHVIEPHAGGVDIGATEIYVAVSADRDPQPVRHFATFTSNLEQLADWLKQCKIERVAMESTGVFWIPLLQIPEDIGFCVCLVNARHVKNVPGWKNDVADCKWLQYLHSVGLLQASRRPPQNICALRSLWRHRESLVQLASVHIQHMQKALDQMNIQLHHVISDLTGTTGLAIVETILARERDPRKLAGLHDPRIAASRDTIAEALLGDYRPEQLFTLRQSLQAYRQYQSWIAECDRDIERYLAKLEGRLQTHQKSLARSKDRHKPRVMNRVLISGLICTGSSALILQKCPALAL